MNEISTIDHAVWCGWACCVFKDQWNTTSHTEEEERADYRQLSRNLSFPTLAVSLPLFLLDHGVSPINRDLLVWGFFWGISLASINLAITMVWGFSVLHLPLSWKWDMYYTDCKVLYSTQNIPKEESSISSPKSAFSLAFLVWKFL